MKRVQEWRRLRQRPGREWNCSSSSGSGWSGWCWASRASRRQWLRTSTPPQPLFSAVAAGGTLERQERLSLAVQRIGGDDFSVEGGQALDHCEGGGLFATCGAFLLIADGQRLRGAILVLARVSSA